MKVIQFDQPMPSFVALYAICTLMVRYLKWGLVISCHCIAYVIENMFDKNKPNFRKMPSAIATGLKLVISKQYTVHRY